MTATAPLLEIENLDLAFGRLVVVQDVSFKVAAGSVVAIVGPNGAGKTTTLTAIAGGMKPLRGRINLSGESLVSRRPEEIAAMGISFVPEGRHVFSGLTVRENLLVGSYMRSGTSSTAQKLDKIYGYFPRLKERQGSMAGLLSGGEQQMLVIGRALMTEPKLMMVDEPSLGLAPRIVDQVYEILMELRRAEGLTLLLNEQSSKRVLKYSDHICVMRGGRIRLQNASDQLRDGTEMRQAYFGFGAGSTSSGAEVA